MMALFWRGCVEDIRLHLRLSYVQLRQHLKMRALTQLSYISELVQWVRHRSRCGATEEEVATAGTGGLGI